ncbi:HSP70/90 co-chaperone [Dimargaris cristalligena]|nr:HSP70/90 co-chaperone [Dimargaris cristalligena]
MSQGPRREYRTNEAGKDTSAPGIEGEVKSADDFLAEMLRSPLFMKEVPEDMNVDDAEENPTMAALQSLAFEGSPTEIATNFKNQGNDCFREGKRGYRDAIKYYTKAIAQDCEDRELTATCYTNRAAVNLELQNYRRVLNDCHAALEINPRNVKALFRSARACRALGKYEEALECCLWALKMEPNNSAVLKEQKLATEERDRVVAKAHQKADEEAQQTKYDAMLSEALKIRKIKMAGSSPSSHVWQNETEHRVRLDQTTGHLLWPVFFLYPEFKETDFVEAFDELDTFQDHLDTILEHPAPWDPKHQYSPTNVELYFEYFPTPAAEPKLLKVGLSCTLAQALSHPRYTVVNSIPAFIMLAKSGSFREQFLAKYK